MTDLQATGQVLRRRINTDNPETSNYTLTLEDSVVRADASGGAFTLTLPSAVGIAGLRYTIERTDVGGSTNALTIDTNASETINGNLTWILQHAESVSIESDGSNWVVIHGMEPSYPGYYYNKGTTPNRRYIAGMLSHTLGLAGATTPPADDMVYALPIIVQCTTKFDTISAEVFNNGGAGSNIRLGVYRDTGNGYPGVLYFEGGNLTGTSTGVKDSTITASLQTFQPGLWWLACANSTQAPRMRILPASGYLSLWPPNFGTTIPGYGYTITSTFGSLPNPFTGGGTLITAVSAVTGNTVPAVGLRPV